MLGSRERDRVPVHWKFMLWWWRFKVPRLIRRTVAQTVSLGGTLGMEGHCLGIGNAEGRGYKMWEPRLEAWEGRTAFLVELETRIE